MAASVPVILPFKSHSIADHFLQLLVPVETASACQATVCIWENLQMEQKIGIEIAKPQMEQNIFSINPWLLLSLVSISLSCIIGKEKK